MTETHRHEWTENPNPIGTIDTWACIECTETSGTCIVTHRNRDNGETVAHASGSSLVICDACLDAEKNLLARIEREALQIEHLEPEPVKAYRLGLARATGSDRERLPFGLDGLWDDPDSGIKGIRTTEGVASELWSWVALWSDASGDYQNLGAVEYLATHMIWAAHNREASDWDRYRTEMRTLLGRVRGLREAVDPSVEFVGPSCFDCGGDLVREWRTDGLGDEVKCRTCLRVYDPPRFRLAFRAKVEREREKTADSLVTEREARTIFPTLPDGNLRTWVARGRIETRGHRRGRVLYRLGDIMDLLGVAV